MVPMAKQSKLHDADPRPDLGRAGSAGRARRIFGFRPCQKKSGLDPRPSINPSASPPRAASAGRPPNRSPRRSPRPTSIDTSCIDRGPRAAAVGAAARLRASRRRRRFDEAAFRPARAGTRRPASVNDEHAYALEISGDSMTPAYRDGDVIVVSPGAPIRRGDRVVVKTPMTAR